MTTYGRNEPGESGWFACFYRQRIQPHNGFRGVVIWAAGHSEALARARADHGDIFNGRMQGPYSPASGAWAALEV